MLQGLLDRYFPAAYRALLQDEFTWRDNPVLRREKLRESRKRDRALLLLVMLGAMLAAFLAMTWALDFFRDRGLFRARVPPVLGGNYSTAFFALFASIQIWFVWHAAHRRSNYLLLQEYRQNSLATLLCTRIPPFQLLLMASAHPFRQGMLAAAAGLPFYIWTLSLGGVSLLELGCLYLIFAMISFRPPRWSLPVFAGIPAEEVLKRMRSSRPKTWGEWWLVNGIWISMFASWYLQWAFGKGWFTKLLLPLTTLVPREIWRILPGFAITWVLALVRFLLEPLPYFSGHLPPIAIILPLYVLARLMAVWESSIHLRTGDADTTQTLWDLGEYWRMRRAYAITMVFALLGFLWKPYISSGGTAALLSPLGGRGPMAVAGFLYLVGFLAALVCWARAREMSAIRVSHGGRLMGDQKGSVVELSAAWEAWYVVSPLVTVYSLYAAACLLSGEAPFPAPALGILGPLLLLAAAGAVYARGTGPGGRRYFFALVLPLLGWFLPAPLSQAGGYLAAVSPLAGLLSLSDHTQRILDAIPRIDAQVVPWYVSSALTTLVGLAANLRLMRNVSRTSPSTADFVTATVPSAVVPPPAPLPGISAAQGWYTAQTSPQAAGTDAHPVAAAPQPATMDGAAGAAPLKGKPFRIKADTPAALRLIAWVQARWDNALAVKELRVLLRGHLGRDEQVAYGLLLLVVTFLVVYRSDISSTILEAPARLAFGPTVTGGGAMFSGRGGAAVVFGGMAAALQILTALVASAAAVSVCGTAFGRERDKSTLGFVLVTPLPTRTILLGKLAGMLGPTILSVLVITTWCAILCLPVAGEIGVGMTIAGFAYGLVLCAVGTVLGGALGLACSTLFRRESDSTAMGFLLLFATFFAASYATAVWPHYVADAAASMPRQWVWLGFVCLAGVILVPAALAFTHWRITRARHGDVAFESATK